MIDTTLLIPCGYSYIYIVSIFKEIIKTIKCDYVLYKNACNEHILRYMCEMCVLWNLLWGTNSVDKEGCVLTQSTLGKPENKESHICSCLSSNFRCMGDDCVNFSVGEEPYY